MKRYRYVRENEMSAEKKPIETESNKYTLFQKIQVEKCIMKNVRRE